MRRVQFNDIISVSAVYAMTETDEETCTFLPSYFQTLPTELSQDITSNLDQENKNLIRFQQASKVTGILHGRRRSFGDLGAT